MVWIKQYANEVWLLTAEMAPWLLVGFAIAGLCSHYLPSNFIEKHLSGNHVKSIFKSVVVGIPLPICSCGVIPVAASLRQKGASRASVASFTAATPQTGVDSIAVTYSLMGWTFTLGRLAANLVSAIAAGLIISFFERNESNQTKEEKKTNLQGSKSCCSNTGSVNHDSSANENQEALSENSGCCNSGPSGREKPTAKRFSGMRDAFREGFVKIPQDIGVYLVVGILLGALISAFFPEGIIHEYVDNNWLQYAVVSLLSVPLYVCATGSIPIAFGLIEAGLAPGAAIVFLVTGPATNTATMATLLKLIGKKETVIYVVTLLVTAWSIGFVFDQYIPSSWIDLQISGGHAKTLNSAHHVSAIALISVFVYAWLGKRTSKNTA